MAEAFVRQNYMNFDLSKQLPCNCGVSPKVTGLYFGQAIVVAPKDMS